MVTVIIILVIWVFALAIAVVAGAIRFLFTPEFKEAWKGPKS